MVSAQYIGLQILEKLIMTRWKTLPDGQRQGKRIILYIRRVHHLASRHQKLCRWYNSQSGIRRDNYAEGEDIHK
jgi:hypothetical protein